MYQVKEMSYKEKVEMYNLIEKEQLIEMLIEANRCLQMFEERVKLNLPIVSRSTKVDKPKLSVKCLHCGRSFIKKQPHKCDTGFRKRNHNWLELTDD